MRIRPAVEADVENICAMLRALTAAGKRTRPSDEDFVRGNYVSNPKGIQCVIAEDENGVLLGLQALSHAYEGNPYGAPVGWGVIGTHVSPNAARRGVGRALFAETLKAARAAALPAIDATIQATNMEGLAFYEGIGFRTYREAGTAICKRFDLD